MPKPKAKPKQKTQSQSPALDISRKLITKTNIFTTDSLSKANKQGTNKQGTNKQGTNEQDVNKKAKKQAKKKANKKANKITIKKYCDNYKHDVFKKQDKSLYNACKINQHCRQYKCHNIDKKFDKIKNTKLGANGNILVMTSIIKKCPIEMSNKSRKKCLNKATKQFYEDNDMRDIYNQVLECDKKTCARERQIFLSNLFRANKTKKQLRNPKQVNLEDIPDQQMIETN